MKYLKGINLIGWIAIFLVCLDAAVLFWLFPEFSHTARTIFILGLFVSILFLAMALSVSFNLIEHENDPSHTVKDNYVDVVDYNTNPELKHEVETEVKTDNPIFLTDKEKLKK